MCSASCRSLLKERISIRDLSTILEGIAEASAYTQNITTITEHVRARLARQITFANTNAEGILPIISLSPKWEKAFSESLIGQGEDRQLAMAPSALQEFIGLIRDRFEEAAMEGEIARPADKSHSAPLRALVDRAHKAANGGDLAKRSPRAGSLAHGRTDLRALRQCA